MSRTAAGEEYSMPRVCRSATCWTSGARIGRESKGNELENPPACNSKETFT